MAVAAGRSFGKTKIFCIGRNKTGTTSLSLALRQLGIITCTQSYPKLLIDDWARRDFRRIIRFCWTAQAFHDQPFSLPFTFQALDQAFPGSKFILTIRDSPEQWYSSLTRYMAKRYGNGSLPTIKDLRNADYISKGWIAKTYPMTHGVPEDDLFNESILIDHYVHHNESIIKYFQQRSGDLLVLNVSEADAWKKLCGFLGKDSDLTQFPWENRTNLFCSSSTK